VSASSAHIEAFQDAEGNARFRVSGSKHAGGGGGARSSVHGEFFRNR
jgi:hypothetical protein